MKKLYYSLLALTLPLTSNAQLTMPVIEGTGHVPDFSQQLKAPGDSCGAYFNNYIGLEKTSLLYYEALRTGNVSEYNSYNGRAQRFTAPQPMEISGVEFFGFETNLAVDSVIAITVLYDYSSVNDSVGAILATDTVWVTHQAFNATPQNISVKSYFDTPVTVANDYIIGLYTPNDDSLKILTSDFFGGDGNLQGLSYLLYDNPAYPSFTGWYNGLTLFGSGYDGDYLINPLVRFDLHDGFTITDDTICPNIVGATCVNYNQMPVFSDTIYNAFGNSSGNHNIWLWGDGFQNANLNMACHTYANSGDYTITRRDTLKRYTTNNPYCIAEITKSIHVVPDVVASFTFLTGGTIVDFTSTSTDADSVWWDFGDTLAGSSQTSVLHTYPTIGTYDVWLYAYNECSEDSVMIQVTVDDVGIADYDFSFKMYPNPANSDVTINGLVDGAKVELINILGETVKRTVTVGTTLQLGTSDLSNGTYFIRVSTDFNQVTKKLLIRH